MKKQFTPPQLLNNDSVLQSICPSVVDPQEYLNNDSVLQSISPSVSVPVPQSPSSSILPSISPSIPISVPPSFTPSLPPPVPPSVPPPVPPSVPLYPEPPIEPNLPAFPDSIFPTLPEFFQKVVAKAASHEERDILLLGSLVCISACLRRVFGFYDAKKVRANLFLFVTAQASAGKGRLVFCKNLVNPIHQEKREQAAILKQKSESEMREYNLLKGKDLSIEKPQRPPELLLFIPANNSSTGVFQLLSDNEGCGLIFETEGDTLSQAFKSDFGNYSDGFRKAFHHETINYYRRTDHEYVEITEPCVSAMLSGTPKQILALVTSAEDGLSSRFMYYRMKMKTVWKDVFSMDNENGLDGYFNALGQEFFTLYKALNTNPEIQFVMTPQQKEEFQAFFTFNQDKYLELNGTEFMATSRRLGLIAFRLCMIFSALRILETGDFSPRMECRDDDFHTVMEMISVLIKHASLVFSELPLEAKTSRPKNKKEMFLEGLPGKFSTQDYLAVSKRLNLSDRTAMRYIAAFCEKNLLLKEEVGMYINLSIAEKRKEDDSNVVD